jgi:hypothetical protein
MGMDIYLESHEVIDRRMAAQKRYYHWVKLRDKEKDRKKQAELQRQVEKWFDRIYSERNGYFRVNYNDYSISHWLQYNIDEKAKGEWGLEPFYSAVKDKEEPEIRSERFRQELLRTARKWYRKAEKLKGKESYLMVMDIEKTDLDKGRLMRNRVVLDGKETNRYIELLKELVIFAELAVKTKSPISVSY